MNEHYQMYGKVLPMLFMKLLALRHWECRPNIGFQCSCDGRSKKPDHGTVVTEKIVENGVIGIKKNTLNLCRINSLLLCMVPTRFW